MSGECEKCCEHCLDCTCLLEDGEHPPGELPPRKVINVNGREEHEALLRDTDKMWLLGLDPTFEKMIYLKRWGSWLNGCTNYLGNDPNQQ